jgi:hypothetical protein
LLFSVLKKLIFFFFFFFTLGHAGPDCLLEVHADSIPGRKYTIYGKNTVNGYELDEKLDAAVPVAGDSERSVVACPFAGNYTIGFTVSGSVPSLGQLDAVTVVRRVGAVYNITPEVDKRTAELVLPDSGWAVFQVTLTQLATPRFDIDLSLSSKADDVVLYYSKNDVTKDVNASRVALDATLDGHVTDLEPGTYWFGVFIKQPIGGSVTRFSVAYHVNKVDDSLFKFPVLVCPSALCNSEDVQSCRVCSQSGCSWCESTKTCSNIESLGCPVPFLTDSSKCVNVQEQCAPHNCTACTADKACVWCERSALTGGSFCSAGKNDLALECPGITDPTEIFEAAKCPDVIEDKFQAADRLCAQKASCTACTQDPTCTYCEAKVGNDRCTASPTCDSIVFAKGINASESCPDVKQCSAFTKCTTCANDATCGWCDVQKKCLPRVNECRAEPGAAAVAQFTNSTLCPRDCTGDACDCSKYTICTNCTSQAHCIFCLGVTGPGKCIDGNGSLVCPQLLDRSRAQCEECAEYPDAFCPRNTGVQMTIAVIVVALAAFVAAFIH